MTSGRKIDTPDYVLLRSDRRKSLRSQLIVLSVKVESGKKSFFGYAKIIGRGGMFIASVNPKKVGDEFMVEFVLPDKTLVRCRGRVVWRREFAPRSPYEPGMGIKFLDLPDNSKTKINEWVRSR